MSHFVCPCLNVQLFCVKGHQEDIILETDLHDTFFSQPLIGVVLDKKGVTIAQPNLVGTRCVGPWTVTSCFLCKKDTHATTTDPDKIFLNASSLLSDATQIKHLLLSPTYSHLYQMVLPPLVDNPLSPTTDNGSPVKSCQFKTVVQAVRQQAANYLFQEQKQMEERVRAYTEKQYALYESLQSKVTRERQSLIELVSCCHQQQQKGGVKMVLPSPFDHFPSPPTSPDNSGSTSSSDLTFDRNELKEVSLPKAIVRLARRSPVNQRVPRQIVGSLPANQNGYQRSKSVDAGTIFDMEGLDDDDSSAFPVSEDEEDTDDSSTTDEMQSLNNNVHKYASSVPISVPYLTTYNRKSNRQENPMPDDPSQIAASIQALALSMRDDKDMFGDLPRRRLNTGDLVKSRPI